MASAVAAVLVRSGAGRLSLREIARETGFSVNNLRHYFKNRDGLITAALSILEGQGEQHAQRALGMTDQPPGEVLAHLLHEIAGGWTTFLGNMHVAGLAEGLGSDTLGPAYVRHILEPTLQTFEAVIASYLSDGRLQGAPARALSLTLVSPPLLALLHQSSLFGATCRPLDVHAFIDTHVQGFIRGYGEQPHVMEPAHRL